MNFRDKIQEIEFKCKFNRELTPEEEPLAIAYDEYINNRLGEK